MSAVCQTASDCGRMAAASLASRIGSTSAANTTAAALNTALNASRSRLSNGVSNAVRNFTSSSSSNVATTSISNSTQFSKASAAPRLLQNSSTIGNAHSSSFQPNSIRHNSLLHRFTSGARNFNSGVANSRTALNPRMRIGSSVNPLSFSQATRIASPVSKNPAVPFSYRKFAAAAAGKKKKSSTILILMHIICYNLFYATLALYSYLDLYTVFQCIWQPDTQLSVNHIQVPWSQGNLSSRVSSWF